MTFRAIIFRPISLAIFLFITSLFIRTVWLDRIPVGIVSDNMIFVLNAKAIFHTGRDVSGLWHPLKFSSIPDEPAQAELPYTIMAPSVGMFSSPMLAAHIFHAVINSFLVVLLFLIVLQLLGKWPAFLVGLVACFNPWSIYFGRSAYEASLALFFYVAGFYILLKTTGWKKLLAIVPLAFGFYSYMAYKLTFLPYVFVISYFVWSQIDRRKYTKQYIVLLGICIFIFLFFVVSVKSQSTSNRLSELTFAPQASVEKQVNTERQIALKNPLANIFSNKASITGKHVIAKYLGAFSPDFLFVSNEGTQRFHIYNHGYFYYIDIVFFIFGFYYLFRQKRKLWMLLTSVMLLAPLPTIVSNVETSYAMRSSLYFAFFYILIGVGIWYALSLVKKKYFFFGVTAIAGLYFVLIANFLYTYFFIQPVYGSEGISFSSRIVARYASLANERKQQITVVSTATKGMYKDFIYYSDLYNKQTAPHFRDAFLNRDYSFENVSFKTCNDIEELEKNISYIFNPGEKCSIFKNVNPLVHVAQISDSGGVYAIYQDAVCSKYNLPKYIHKLTMDDLLVEKLSEKKFCETYIVDYEKSI